MQLRATELYIQRIFIRAFIEYANQFELIAWSVWIIHFPTEKLLFNYYDRKPSETFFKQMVHASACVIVEYYKARGEFGEHEREIRIARCSTESNSSLYSPNFQLLRSHWRRRGRYLDSKEPIISTGSRSRSRRQLMVNVTLLLLESYSFIASCWENR